MTVHVAGNACIDTTFSLSRLPRPGETLNARSGTRGLGGKGANQAVAAARSGAATALHAAIGTDADGAAIRAHLVCEALDLRGLVEAEGPSDGSAILVDAGGENVIVSLVERARSFDPMDSPAFADSLGAGDMLLMQGNLPPDVTHRCLAFARSRKATTVFNASPLEDGGEVLPDDVDWLVVNAGEARQLAGTEDLDEAVRRLLQRGPAALLLSLGPRGALIANRYGDVHRVPAGEVEAVDSSGAGDLLCGVFAGLLSLGHAPDAAVRTAVACAGLSVSRSGTLLSYPSAAEIAAHLPSF